ncbi:hypothetical protein Hypma_007825 [Hypsizygus marmoreus]|uniref:Uncharacterized protein n=1 Tax=Hypsizygus marmoreus TaxID=39966 RepID=A0A369JYN2_HYPMA|nr:hypothetical protein Hypma_007825 [Hypsizygus marmoreus]
MLNSPARLTIRIKNSCSGDVTKRAELSHLLSSHTWVGMETQCKLSVEYWPTDHTVVVAHEGTDSHANIGFDGS